MEIDKKVIEELRESANVIMMHELKSYYLLGDTDEYDNFNPEKINEASATPFEVYKKACCMYAGYKTKEDEKGAEVLWEKMGAKKESNSLVELSVSAFIKDDYEAGFKYIQKSANLGNPVAQYRVAICYFLGIGTKEDGKKAFSIISKLAEEDFPNAVYLLGSFYFNDNGVFVTQDRKMGWDLIKKASTLGSSYAQYEVAMQYFIKKNGKADFSEVVDLMEKAAEGGDLRALYVLALAYAKGEGVKVDLDKSMRYLAQSYEGGFPLAVQLMETISKKAGN